MVGRKKEIKKKDLRVERTWEAGEGGGVEVVVAFALFVWAYAIAL
jgi:hypothetical protein